MMTVIIGQTSIAFSMPDPSISVPAISKLVERQNDLVLQSKYREALKINSKLILEFKKLKPSDNLSPDYFLVQAKYDRAVLFYREKKYHRAVAILRELFVDPNFVKYANSPPKGYFSSGIGRQFYSEFSTLYEKILLETKNDEWKFIQDTSIKRLNFFEQEPIDLYSSEYLSSAMRLASRAHDFDRAKLICETRLKWHDGIMKSNEPRVAAVNPNLLVKDSYIYAWSIAQTDIVAHNKYYVAEFHDNCGDVYEAGGKFIEALYYRQMSYYLGLLAEGNEFLFESSVSFKIANLLAKMGKIELSLGYLEKSIVAYAKPNQYDFTIKTLCDNHVVTDDGIDIKVVLHKIPETRALLVKAGCDLH